MSTRTTHRLVSGINELQANHLDHFPSTFSIDPMLSHGLGLVRIDGMSRSWEDASEDQGSMHSRQVQLLAGLYNAEAPWGIVIHGHPGKATIYLALTGGGDAFRGWQRPLEASFPGCTLSRGPAPSQLLEQLFRFPCAAALSGNPSTAGRPSPPHIYQPRLEPLIGTMIDARWAYVVLAAPIASESLRRSMHAVACEERETVSAFMRPGTIEEHNNPLAQQYLSLLQAARSKMEEGQRNGMWRVQAYILAEDALGLARGGQALAGVFAGPDCLPQPFRVRPCVQSRTQPDTQQPSIMLSTSEAAAISQLPCQEFPGYMLRERVGFSVSPPVVAGERSVAIGNIMDGGNRSGNWFELDVDDFAKHVFVAGVPGSGKTQTCQYLLSQLWSEQRIPWLVVEPSSKSEYRSMTASAVGRDVQVYTLGDETCAPLRLNPLEVPRGMPVQTHIEAISSLFAASFALVTPMPDVLNQALHQVYVDLGWNLLRGTNPKGYAAEVQPTISNLIRTLERIIPTLGYDTQITGNLRAGLVTRLRNLTLGGKGAMLNSGLSANMTELLEKPTVMELGAIGDDDSKAFVIASVLLHLSEFRMLSGLSGGRLRHVTLIEEAHRLLRTVPESLATEYANPRGKAVDAICQMLAEMRAYGEGFVIVDQVPAKLAPDAIKNTNLKIIHRLVAGDDRELVGTTMNLSESQQRHLAALPSGQAVVYAEGWDASFLVQVPNHAGGHGYGNTVIADTEIKHLMQNKIAPLPARAEDLDRHHLPPCQGCEKDSCDRYHVIARRLLENDYSQEFAYAVQKGPESIWGFGGKVAADTWGGTIETDMPYCVVLTLMSLAGYRREIIESMQQQLEAVRIKFRMERK